MLAEGAISVRSNKQTIVALSAFEAEYVAASLACKGVIWFSRLHVYMLNQGTSKCIEIRNDNRGAIPTAKNTVINQRNKHIDLKYHFVRDCTLQRKSTCSNDQLPNKTRTSSLNTFGKWSLSISVQSLDYWNRTQGISPEREHWMKTSLDAFRRLFGSFEAPSGVIFQWYYHHWNQRNRALLLNMIQIFGWHVSLLTFYTWP